MNQTEPVFRHELPPMMDKEPIPIRIGDVISIEGHSYVVVSYDIKAATNGRSCSLTSLDPWFAESERLKEQRYQEAERVRVDMLKKQTKFIDKHSHEEG